MGYPPYMGGWLLRAAYGLKDAPCLWWNKLDACLRSYGLKHTRAGKCCYVWHGPARRNARSPEALRKAGHAAQKRSAARVCGRNRLGGDVGRVQVSEL